MNLRELGSRVLRRRRGEVEQRAVTALPWDTGGSTSRPVNIDNALSLVPVFGAVRLLASQIASLPLHTYRRAGDSRVRIPTGSLFSGPAARGTLYDWIHRAVTSLALRGNAYGLITRRDPTTEYPTMVEWLHPDDVYVNDLSPSGPGSYSDPTWYWKGRVILSEDLVHIPWFTLPGRVAGLSPIEACAVTIATGNAAQGYTATWFDNGAVPPGTYRNSQKTIKQAEAEEISARLLAAIRRKRPLVHGNDWEYTPIAVSAHEAKFVETLRLNATQVATIFGVPPEMIGGEAGGPLTYNTQEQNALNLEKFTLRPWLEMLEEAFSALIPRPQYVRFNVDALLRTDLQTRITSYQTARNIGLMNVDECRALEDLPPLPGGLGQDYTPLMILEKAAGQPTPSALAASARAEEPVVLPFRARRTS